MDNIQERLNSIWSDYRAGKLPLDGPKPDGLTMVILSSRLPSPIENCRCAAKGHAMKADKGDTVFLMISGKADEVESACVLCPSHAAFVATLDRWGEYALVWGLAARRLMEDALDLFVQHETELHIVREAMGEGGSIQSRDSAPMH